jgi:hypothetical protein
VITDDPSKAVMVFLDNAQVDVGNGTKRPLKDKWTCWTECAEDDVDFGQQSTKMDPIVKLRSNSPIMPTENKSVREGLANGNQATFQKLVPKHGETIFQTAVDGVRVDFVFASQISRMQLRHTSGKQQVFSSKPKSFDFKDRFPKPLSPRTRKSKTENVRDVSATQLPVISNNATAGHKLQGSTKDRNQKLELHGPLQGEDAPRTLFKRAFGCNSRFHNG